MEQRDGIYEETRYVTFHLLGIRLIYRGGRYDGWYHYRLGKALK